ncbi:TonB-dependent receptor plug domain-containing protein [Pseudarcicella hirudinis]|uniref:TonB-dependent receptor plug domain-containing protein n=1 Tax=Pseudarcicella hirudinis TaxID=1079859 RepID=UPI0035E5B6FD
MKNFTTKIILLCSLMLWGTVSRAQQRTMTGKVTDVTGAGLPGVSILVKDTKTGTTSDVNGNYKISIPQGSKSIIFSFVGMVSSVQAIGNKSVLNVTLENDVKDLAEVVVIGYGTARKADITSSISSVSEKDIKNLPVPGADQALQGKVAGVTVTSNGGQPGGGVSVKVRGITSVNGNEPLYVIDGVPILSGRSSIAQDQLGGMAGQSVQSPLAAMNPNDIASIDILKDASAQAIYGALAANGVVLITTKKGKKAGKGK